MRVPLTFESSIRREARLQYRASSFEKPGECHRGFHGEIPVLEYLGGPGQLSPRAGRVSSLLHGHTGDGVAPIRVACPAQGANLNQIGCAWRQTINGDGTGIGERC